MKHSLVRVALAACGMLGLPLGVHAQTVDGTFVNANVGSASLDGGLGDKHETSYGLHGGYRWAISPGGLLGVEAGYVDFGNYSFPATFVTLDPLGTPPGDSVTVTGRGHTQVDGWTLGATGRFNFAPRWYVDGRAGYLHAGIDTRLRYTALDGSVIRERFNSNADGWYAGAGVGFDVSDAVSIGLHYDYHRIRDHGASVDPDVVSMSGEFRF
ncbi:outer membrane protein [Dokdonella immobilis]|uniref:OmpA-OmpF porin, OOP family/outer membrane immunogenic protein n=1 Tax=Dokdonella immobilis TaxID=578942 RepID=A0A1I4V0Q5_9GAMM|nr:autotransporter outer membrane beta-barrel domain-containing protein [Dokdonella immobilis]SFM94741.1 OmpA-OmpF porin, OOP family/outer membrane immunogenic protein [Dokdonella immobilis]